MCCSKKRHIYTSGNYGKAQIKYYNYINKHVINCTCHKNGIVQNSDTKLVEKVGVVINKTNLVLVLCFLCFQCFLGNWWIIAQILDKSRNVYLALMLLFLNQSKRHLQ